MITVSFAGSDKLVIEAVSAKAEDITEAVTYKLDELDVEMQSFIVSEELHGEVLRQQSGKLAGSIRIIPAVRQGGSIVGQVEGGGGPTGIGNGKSYAELFEYGSPVDIVPVNAKALRFQIDGHWVFAKKVHLELPRPFMAPALVHMTPRILAGVEEVISEELAK